MRTPFMMCLCWAMLAGACTSLDFFGYADDAPLLAVERPESYNSAAFGAAFAATGSSATDLLAVCGGGNTQVAFFSASQKGKLSDLSSPDTYYPPKWSDAQNRGVGAALAGLPAWQSFASDEGKLLVEGCLAVGEPRATPPSIRIVCRADKRLANRLELPSVAGEPVPPEDGFGLTLSSIRPAQGGSFLLATGGDTWLAVYASSQPGDSTSAADLAMPGDASKRKLAHLAGGRAEILVPWSNNSQSIFFVTAASTAKAGGDERIQLFVENGNRLEPMACWARPNEPGFGGVMATGDLDGDGNDELVVSASDVEGRVDRVYVYSISSLIEQARVSSEACLTEATPLAVIASPKKYKSTSCGKDCGFGLALAIGDIATDDNGPELAIGAPKATAQGVEQAGAVYLWRSAQILSGEAAAPASYVMNSTPEKKDAFGSALVVAPMAGRNELVIGAPGASSFFVAFCTNLGEDIEAGADVTRNAGGKVISTRCRLK